MSDVKIMSIRGGTLTYRDSGCGDNVVVLVHGVFVSSRLWNRMIENWPSEGNTRIIAIDLPGHGGSDPHLAEPTMIGLATLITEVLDELKIDRFHLMGNNTGGLIAQALATGVGAERLCSFTLTNCDTYGNFPPLLFTPLCALARRGWLVRPMLLMGKSQKLIRQLYRLGFKDLSGIPHEETQAYAAPIFCDRRGAEYMQNILAHMSNESVRTVDAELERLDVPTLFIWGMGDIFFGIRWGYALAERLPSLTGFHTIAGARLWFVRERWAEVLPLVTAHVVANSQTKN